MDKHEPGNSSHISMDTSAKLNVHKTLLWCVGPYINMLYMLVCPLGYRNISKLLNDQNVHFHYKSHKNPQINEHKADYYLN